MNVSQAVKALLEAKATPNKRTVLLRVPTFVDCVRRCRKFMGDHRVRAIADEVFEVIQLYFPIDPEEGGAETFWERYSTMSKAYLAEHPEWDVAGLMREPDPIPTPKKKKKDRPVPTDVSAQSLIVPPVPEEDREKMETESARERREFLQAKYAAEQCLRSILKTITDAERVSVLDSSFSFLVRFLCCADHCEKFGCILKTITDAERVGGYSRSRFFRLWLC